MEEETVKVLTKVCQQIWKTTDWERLVETSVSKNFFLKMTEHADYYTIQHS